MLALLSVSDKRGLVPFAQGLVRLGYSLLSTGGTLDALKAANVPAKKVSEHTGSPEILGGRVKTLHPKIHGGILGRPTLPEDAAQMKENGIEAISLVAVNLYPFRETVAKGATRPLRGRRADRHRRASGAMVRASAKNSAHVTIVVDPDDYDAVLKELDAQKSVSEATRKKLMRKAFAHTAAYDDSAISAYLAQEAQGALPQELTISVSKGLFELRYGERNPHQRGAFYREGCSLERAHGPAFSKVLQGKELSYNNLLDLDAALGLLLEFPGSPCAVIIKHNTPCGVALDPKLETAYRKARAADEVSAFGGIVALNREVDEATGKALAETFLEAVIAPSYSAAALKALEAKKNLRLLEAGPALASPTATPRAQLDTRSISGGLLVMDRDAVEPVSEWKVVSKRSPTATELEALKFAWRVCKHVKSNAIDTSRTRPSCSLRAAVRRAVASLPRSPRRAGVRSSRAVPSRLTRFSRFAMGSTRWSPREPRASFSLAARCVMPKSSLLQTNTVLR